MINGKTLATVLDKLLTKSEVAQNARIQVQMPNGDLHDITEIKLMEVKTDAPRSVKLYESSAVTESGLSLVRSKACALDDWTAIRDCLLGRLNA
jgi:hypothetical protein